MRSILLLGLVLLAAACTSADPMPETTATTVATSAPATTTTTTSTTAPPETVPPTSSTTTSTTTTTTTEPPPELLGVELQLVADADRVLAIAAPAGDQRVFLAERHGVILAVDPAGETMDFLDISDRVRANGIEQGLLGLAFHPAYDENGRFYVYYTDANDDTRLSEFIATGGMADPASERQLLLLDQPTDRHNGGMLEFGNDGYLYVSVGDGGDGGHHGQQADTLLGTILRLDVDGGEPYAIPPDNPFATGGGAAEVFVYGLRNPWRFAIDEGEIYIADVGQESWEEVTVLSLGEGGANLGWAYREGSACFSSPECDETDTVLPTIEYDHGEGCSITGGFVYRGDAIPELHGLYFYADWCQGWVRSFRYENGEALDLREWTELEPGQVNTFGIDADGELYFASWGGSVWKLVPIRADE